MNVCFVPDATAVYDVPRWFAELWQMQWQVKLVLELIEGVNERSYSYDGPPDGGILVPFSRVEPGP